MPPLPGRFSNITNSTTELDTMASKKHTHLLARSFSFIGEDGERVHGITGDPYSPTQAQLQNMPDCFVTTDRAPVAGPTDTTGVKGWSVSQVQEKVEQIGDIHLLRKMAVEEGESRDRKGAQRAISDRILELEEEEDEGKKEDGDGTGEGGE